MRKLILVLLIMLSLGCENTSKKLNLEKEKFLTCSVNDYLENYYSTDDIYDFTFDEDGKNLKKYTENLKLVYGRKLSDENKKELYEQALHQCDICNQHNGIDCEITQDEKGFSMSIEIIVNELTGDKINFDDREKELYNDYTYEQLKERQEKFGRTCK